MHRRAAKLACLTVLAVSTFVPITPAQTPRPITETDLYAFTWIADPRISPDGSRIIYVQVSVASKHDSYESSLWIIDTAGGSPRQITRGPSDTEPRWSPDGKLIAFLRAIEKQPAQIFVLSLDGGEPRPLTDMPTAVSGIVWSPDSRAIAFTSTALPKDFDKKKDDPEPSDVRVISRAVYRANTGGYLDATRPNHIWVADVLDAPRKARQLTSGEFAESGIAWSPDGARIYFTSNRVSEPYYQPPDDDIYSVPAAGGDIAKIASIDGPISTDRSARVRHHLRRSRQSRSRRSAAFLQPARPLCHRRNARLHSQESHRRS